MKIFLIQTVLWLVLLCSCTKTQDAATADVAKLADAYAELVVFNEHYTLAKDTLSPQQYEAGCVEILRRYALTKEQFTTEFAAASQSSELFRQLCDRAQAKLQSRRPSNMPNGMRGRS